MHRESERWLCEKVLRTPNVMPLRYASSKPDGNQRSAGRPWATSDVKSRRLISSRPVPILADAFGSVLVARLPPLVRYRDNHSPGRTCCCPFLDGSVHAVTVGQCGGFGKDPVGAATASKNVLLVSFCRRQFCDRHFHEYRLAAANCSLRCGREGHQRPRT